MSEKNLLEAMAMEKEYRKLRLDWKAKTAFGYHEKLKQLGFDNTSEYERAKDEHYLKDRPILVLEIGASEFLGKLKEAVIAQKETVFVVTPEKLLAWVGTDDYDRAYCDSHEIPVYEVGYSGGTIVTGVEDVAIGLLLKKKNIQDTFAKIIYEEISKYFPNAEWSGNDILVSGHKVLGIGTKAVGTMFLTTYQITFKTHPDAIKAICKKEMKKQPKGMAELGTVKRADLIKAIKRWLK